MKNNVFACLETESGIYIHTHFPDCVLFKIYHYLLSHGFVRWDVVWDGGSLVLKEFALLYKPQSFRLNPVPCNLYIHVYTHYYYSNLIWRSVSCPVDIFHEKRIFECSA